MRIRTFLVSILLLVSLAPSITAQQQSSGRKQGARLSRSKPSVYISFLRFGKREPVHTGESDEGVWLRLHNNTRWPLVLNAQGAAGHAFALAKEEEVGLFVSIEEVPRSKLSVTVPMVMFTLVCGSSAIAQSTNPCDDPNNLPSSFFEVPQGPQGNWRASVSPEPQQAGEPPVVVVGAGAIQGPVNRRGMRLGCGVLRNRSQKSVATVQLRWILVRNHDRSVIAQKGYTPETVLREGYTPSIDLSIPKESLRRTDFSIISFAAVTKDLAKEGILSGDYFLFIGVYEVLFEDGSIWHAGPAVR